MNRRAFLASLGIGSAALMIDPKSLLAATPEIEVFAEYPKLYFTGFSKLMFSDILSSQFLWTVEYVDESGVSDITHWFCNVSLDCKDPLYVSPDTRKEYIRERIKQGIMSVTHLMDGIVSNAINGEVETGGHHRIINPDFNPELPESSIWDEEIPWNPKTLPGGPIMKRITSMKFGTFGNGAKLVPVWDVERLVGEL